MVSGDCRRLALIAAIGVSAVAKYLDRAQSDRYLPDSGNPDPSADIAGVTEIDNPASDHVRADPRAAYDQSPFGGARHAVWATCTGRVYSPPIRTENAVHTVEHGAEWLTYDPQRLTGEQVPSVINIVKGQPYTLLSLYPGLRTASRRSPGGINSSSTIRSTSGCPGSSPRCATIPTPMPSPRCTSTRPTLPRSTPARQDQTGFR